MSDTSEPSNETIIHIDLVPSRVVQFWTYLIVEIPSLACLIYLLYQFLSNKKLRHALHNHVIIILLFLCLLVEIIDNPLYLDAFLHGGRSSFSPSPTVCLIWWLVDYGVYSSLTVFLAWASFERNMLIFYRHRCFGTRRRRLLFHYIPLGILTIYSASFYIGVMIFPPCENIYDYELDSCGSSPCFAGVPWLAYWDNLVNQILCILLEVVFNVCLIVRTIHQRYRIRHSVHWRQHRKMTIQLLSISSLSLSITLPVALLSTIQNTRPDIEHFVSMVATYFYYLNSFVVFFLPLICLASSPELWPTQCLAVRRRFQRTVVATQVEPARMLPSVLPS